MKLELQFFGGRGSSSSLPMNNTPGGGGGGGPEGDLDQQPGLSRSAAEALGERGRPMSTYNAVNGANPNFEMGEEYQYNCQRCIIATEARFRGYDVQALPTHNGDTMPTGNNYLNNFVGATSSGINHTTAGANKRDVESQMSNMGNGSRAVMSFGWSGGDGHVINVVQRNGRTRYYDGQNGTEVNGTALFNAMARRSLITLTRVDNLAFSDTVNQAIRPTVGR